MVICIFLLSTPLLAQDLDATDEYQIKKLYQRERVNDFYSRYSQLEATESERRNGEGLMRAERKQLWQASERARTEYVKERKLKPVEDPLMWEKESRERAQQAERDRREYVAKRNELNKWLKREGEIPEEDEFDLYLDEATD